MANWAGFDTTSFTYMVGPRGVAGTACNPSNQTLATYTANHYAGRTPTSKYFCRYFQVTSGFSPFDPAEVSTLRAATFFYIVPISAPSAARESQNDATGKTWGQQDATTCLNNILAVLNGGYGVTPNSATVYIYLDIEAGVPISAWYWEGWSETIFNRTDPTWGNPWFPAVYANPNDTTTMAMLASYASDSQHQCRALWSTQPNASSTQCTWCNNNSGPTWGPTGYTGLYTAQWQYTLDDTCWTGSGCNLIPPSANCCDTCRPHVDNDQSDPSTELTNSMLRIT